jgi:F-type H+-transporting ATPase subunit b
MHIDWFVLLAQLVNFLILIYLLKRFLYTRIIQAMNEREAKIAARFDEAERLKREAEEAARVYEEKNSFLQGQEEEMLNQAREVVNHRQKNGWIRPGKKSMRFGGAGLKPFSRKRPPSGASPSANRETGFCYCRKILDDLADTAIESKMVDVLIDRIHSLDPAEREKICSAWKIQKKGQSSRALLPFSRKTGNALPTRSGIFWENRMRLFGIRKVPI